ncbi:MAG: spondin domain-containing protein [Desulfobacterales bacterium]|nr:MAG: spondin domain-containing protein [Desulfobacterales bacterium]
MRHKRYALTVTFLMIFVLASGVSFADQERYGRKYEITITNLTRGQVFSPPVVISHTRNFDLFRLGQEASPELAALAEDGLTEPLVNSVAKLHSVFETAVGDFILPGDSLTVEIPIRGAFRLISVAGMLVTSNDAFFAARGIQVPARGKVVVAATAYDAGSEANSEDCAFIPGPPCNNPNVHDADNPPEGYVFVHAGIHGVGPQGDGLQVEPARQDWRYPVSQITLRAVY